MIEFLYDLNLRLSLLLKINVSLKRLDIDLFDSHFLTGGLVLALIDRTELTDP